MVLPAASLATVVMVLTPADRVRDLLNDPSVPTSTVSALPPLSLMVNVICLTGDRNLCLIGYKLIGR